VALCATPGQLKAEGKLGRPSQFWRLFNDQLVEAVPILILNMSNKALLISSVKDKSMQWSSAKNHSHSETRILTHFKVSLTQDSGLRDLP
jgi:hypothetical protein